MKILLTTLLFCLAMTLQAQTSKELLGKWKLVKFTQHGKEKDIMSTFKSDQVFQVFLPDGKFQSIVGGETHKSKWKLSKDNSELTIISSLIVPIKFHIDYFDSKKRIITSEILGTLEYQKVEE